MALARHGQALVLDADLTGRKVSPTSTTYQGAGFGYMDGEVANGFQAAITSLTGGPCGRLLASVVATIEPVVASILAFLFLGERLDLAQIVGGALILVAVISLTRAQQA